jgi:hypothetical protein
METLFSRSASRTAGVISDVYRIDNRNAIQQVSPR